MTLVTGRRGCGKTKRLVKWSAKTGGWILVSTLEGKKFVERVIHDMNLVGKAHVFCKGDLVNHRVCPPNGTKVSIDNFEQFLEQMLPQYDINEITFGSDNIKRLRGGIKPDV